MTINTNYQSYQASQASLPPDRKDMLTQYNLFEKEYAQLMADLAKQPPSQKDIENDLSALMGYATAMQKYSYGNSIVAPMFGLLFGSLQDAMTLAQSGDYSGIQNILTNPGDGFQYSLGQIRMFIIHDTVSPSNPPDFQDMLTQIGLLQQYLARFEQDLKDGNYNDANLAMGYLMTEANDLAADANYDPAISPLVEAIVANVYDMRALLNGSPPDYQGCLDLLENGTLATNMIQVMAFILAQEE